MSCPVLGRHRARLRANENYAGSCVSTASGTSRALSNENPFRFDGYTAAVLVCSASRGITAHLPDCFLVWSARKYSQCLLRLVGSGCRVWWWPSKAALSGAAIGVLIGIKGVLALGRPPGRMLAALILADSRMIRLLFVSGLSDEMLGYVLPTVRASMVKSGLGWHLSTWTSKGT
jgi:hypothetical protein